MKNSDIETLGKIAFVLGKYLPDTEFELFKEYLNVYERLKVKNDLEKQRYIEKSEYHRETTRQWRKDNAERYKEYQKNYNKNKLIEENRAKKAKKQEASPKNLREDIV